MSSLVATLRTWRSVLAQPHVSAVFATTGLGRLARASVPLALVLAVAESTGSYAWAGAAAAALTLADAVTAPLKGRLADRYGRAAVLLPLAVLYAVALVALASSAHRVWVLGWAALAGVAFPPISGSVKALLPLLVREDGRLRAAYTLESTVQQVLFFAGPVYVASVGSAFSPVTALYGAALSIVLGVVGFVVVARAASASASASGAPGARPRSGALGVPAVLVLTGTTLLQSISFGANGVAVPASAAAFGVPEAAGLALAAGSIGGLAGSLLIASAATGGRDPRARYVRMLLAAAAGYAPMVVLPFPLVAVCLFGAGLVVTPVAATAYSMLSAATPEGLRTEAFTWLSTAVATGSALGAAVAGLVADHAGAPMPLLIAPLAAAAAALLAGTGRSALAAPD